MEKGFTKAEKPESSPFIQLKPPRPLKDSHAAGNDLGTWRPVECLAEVQSYLLVGPDSFGPLLFQAARSLFSRCPR